MKVLIIGKGDMLANLIRGALLAGADIVGVLRYENLYSSGLKLFLSDFFKSSSVLTLIKKHNLNDIRVKSANSDAFKNIILKNEVDVLLVGTWAEKLNNDVINMPKIASINVHPSLLPKYRGPNPYLQTIWHREPYSGVTFHLMSDKLDAGPILYQEKIPISEYDTGKELRNKTVFRARLICARLLKSIDSGAIKPVVQDETSAFYFPDIKPEDMTLDFLRETSDEIMAHVRAFYPFAPTYIQDGNTFWVVNPYKIRKVNVSAKPMHIVSRDKQSMVVAAKDGLCVEFSGLKKYRHKIKIGF